MDAYALREFGLISVCRWHCGNGIAGAVPILAGGSAYAMAETFTWREGLYLKLRQAWGFYGVIAFSTVLGATMNFLGINPI